MKKLYLLMTFLVLVFALTLKASQSYYERQFTAPQTEIDESTKIDEDNSLLIGVDESIDLVYKYMLHKDYELAIYTVNAGVKYHIDPLLLTALINSETGYIRDIPHKLDFVQGLGGINTRFWDIPNRTYKEQVEACAYVLRTYLDKYENNLLKALTGYKGVSKRGERQARLVLSNYENYIGE